MEIESLKKTRYNNCYIIFKEGEELSVSMDIAVKYKLKKNLDIPDDLIIQIKTEQQYIESKRVAHNYISYKPRSEYQVRQKLADKNYPDDVIESAIKFLYEFDYLDDTKFAKMFAEQYLAKKPSGKSKLRSELNNKGIDEGIINQIVRDSYENNDVNELIRQAAKKKLRQVSYKPIDKQKTALNNYLQRQGFDFSLIKEIIAELFTD